jgi:hypothetical protein
LKAINQGRVDPANYVWSKSGKGESWKMALRLRTGEINYSTFIMEGRKSAARLTGADRIVLGDVEEHIGKFAGAALGALFFKIFGAWGQELGGQELQSSSDRFISDLAQNWVRVDGFEAAELPDLFRYAIHLQQNILACGLTSGEVVPS